MAVVQVAQSLCWSSSSSVCTLHDPVARVKSLKKAVRLSAPPPRPSLEYGVLAAAARRSVRASSSSSSSSSSEATIKPKLETQMAFKHVLLPIIDRNPYLSDSTRQTVATTTALAKQYGADVTVVVIDHCRGSEEEAAARDESKEAKEKHELQLDTIRWHLSEGGCEEYTLVEKMGWGQKPAAVIGEMADDMGLDLVIMSMEAIHHKHVDGNLLGEFVPCPILMLPL